MPDIKLITENLADELIPGIQKSVGIYILTSFVMESGVKLLSSHLKQAAERGAEVRVLAGDYLFVTQPGALRLLQNIDPRIEIRLWRSRGTSFHPKAYLFDYDEGQGLFIVGSSNFSLSAFRLGIEWNLAVNAKLEPYTFQEALDKYMQSFYHENTDPLNEETLALYEKEYNDYHQKNPELIRMITEMEESELMLPHKEGQPTQSKSAGNAQGDIKPRFAQPDALEALESTYAEGYRRAMVVMATGLGKTYLAGFFAQRFKRVLFIAHREEILQQAKRSFQHIMPHQSSGLYNGTEKVADADFVFASIFTLGMKKHRERFAPDAFELIVIDEFHHAAAKSYQAILKYFQPQFLLGITATPHRMDGKDVYGLCDGNVAYQLHFLEAIQRGWLCPFHYYGVYDDTDYTELRWLGGRYDEEALLAVQLREEVAQRIHAAWMKHKQTRTLAFCSSIVQANFLAKYFRAQGHAVLSLHSQTKEMTREQAIRQLGDGGLEVIFTVDLFNEGVDIPEVDTLLFVRPTESLTVFTQQVGRGLRLHERKSACTIIDLIGNYRNADLKLSLFDTQVEEQGSKSTAIPSVPAGCLIDLEVGVIQLLDELRKKRQPRKEKLKQAYDELKQELGRRPSYLELHLNGKADSREYAQEFGSYVGFLYWAEQLNEVEMDVFRQHERWLYEVEETRLTKSYKMVVLLSMLDRGVSAWRDPIRAVDAAPFFHSYLTEKAYRRKIDFADGGTEKLLDYDEKKVAQLIARMPMSKWSGSSKGLVTFKEGLFEIHLEVAADHEQILYDWTREICLYRLHGYFERRAKS